ncbi:MAG: pur operon repressor [Eubacteriales bacterium]|nr:pur operon repressor [Eubacteriales bacterium]
MERIKRGERLAAMARILTNAPNRLHTLGEFCMQFDTAKSTVSEDIDILRESFARFHLGTIITVAGASGGVMYRSLMSPESAQETLGQLAATLSEPGRLLPGGFLYTADVCSNPDTAGKVGDIMASLYCMHNPDFVLTMETSGIPVALMTARALDVPLVIARRDSRAYEGPAVKINYVAGNDKIETMTLARKAVRPGKRALIIDDFTKGGGTLRGMAEMMREFDAPVVGIGVMIATAEPVRKRAEGIRALLTLESTDPEAGSAIVRPAKLV